MSRIDIPQEYENLHDSIFKYKMNHSRRGRCLIINNKKFDEMGLRTGAEQDEKNLKESFLSLGFQERDIKIKTDLKTAKMRKELEKLAEKDYTDNDCLICCILTHGDENYLYGTDGSVENYLHANELTNIFVKKGHRTLAGKPKIFFIQVCRGRELDDGSKLVDDGVVESAGPGGTRPVLKPRPKHYQISEQSDFLLAWAAPPGYFSFRNNENGSWFIQELGKVLKKDGQRLEIHQILSRVNYLVSYRHSAQAEGKAHHNKKLSPCFESRLTKELYFSYTSD